MPADVSIPEGYFRRLRKGFFGSLPESFSSGFPKYLVEVCRVDLGVSLPVVSETISSVLCRLA